MSHTNNGMRVPVTDARGVSDETPAVSVHPRTRPSGDVEWGIPEQTVNELTAQPETAPAVQTSGPAYARLKPAQMHLILQLAAEERQQIDIAQIVGVHVSTVSRFLKQIGDPHKIVQQVMQGDSLHALIDWKRARRTAAKRGDHRPAREWLEAAYPEFRPQPSPSHNHAGVTVIVAVPGGDQNPRPVIQVGSSSTQLIDSE